MPTSAPTQLRRARRLTAYAPRATAVHARPHSATCGNASGSLNHRLLNASTLSAGGSTSSSGAVVAAGSVDVGSVDEGSLDGGSVEDGSVLGGSVVGGSVGWVSSGTVSPGSSDGGSSIRSLDANVTGDERARSSSANTTIRWVVLR